MPGRLARDIKQSKPFFSQRLEVYFNLLRTTDLLNRTATDLLKVHELSGTQYNVLRILRGAVSTPDGGLPCSEIGARLITHDPDVTRLLDRLEKRGLVQRARRDTDRRVVLVRITPAGSELLETCDQDRRLTDAFAPHFAGLSSDDCKTLITLLENLRQS